MATVYVIGTPIGNLEDITLRALRILGEVDLIACEDTRMTAKLLSKYEIRKPLLSYHAQSKLSQEERIISLLGEGKNIALVSDAGTPAISDPGSRLIARIKEALPEALVIPIPGPSALISALSASGLPASEFVFLGFLPHKKGRETLFGEISTTERTVAFYESPHRILKALASLQKHFEASGTPLRKVVIGRELTKIYEETVSGSPTELLAYFAAHPDKVRGEFVVMVAPRG